MEKYLITMDKTKLIEKLKDAGVINIGNYTLKSGKKSVLYFDFKSLVSEPDLLYNVSLQLSTLILDRRNIVVGGVPMGGIPFSIMISHISRIPSILIRDEQKEYGKKKLVEGKVGEIVLIEDVITTGKSVLKTINSLKKGGFKVREIICIINRGEKTEIE